MERKTVAERRARPAVTALFDVDNTLLDNDRVTADLKQHLRQAVGPEEDRQYWVLFEQLREELGYADYLGALQRYRIAHPRDAHLLEISHFLIDYPFAERLLPRALEVVAHVARTATPVILSDGDVVFQPRKIERAGLFDAFEGRVLVYIHKERDLDDVERRYPADRYVLIDDKLRILTAVKQQWGDRVTTIFARQGHYALDPDTRAAFPPPDLTVDHIADLLQVDLSRVCPKP